MAKVQFISGRAALGSFIGRLSADMANRLDSGGYSTSNRLKDSIDGTIKDGVTISGVITALDYWQYVGNGRGPGKMPPVSPLIKWALAKGLATNENEATSIGWAIAKGIAREGSLDFQLKGKNVFEQAILDSQDEIEAILDAFLRDAEEITIQQFNTAFRA